MKLRNKRTREIVDYISWEKGGVQISMYVFDTNKHYYYNSLAELNEEWEDASEEPLKSYWFINDLDGEPMKCELKKYTKSSFIKWSECRKQIGNYFETKQEAEKALEKLKAWKRLKDKGFRFIGVRGIGKEIDFDIPKPYNHIWFDEYNAPKNEKEFYDDLLLLFGGEE